MPQLFRLSASENSISPTEETTFDPLPIGESSTGKVWIHATEGVDITITDVSINSTHSSGTVTVIDTPTEVEAGESEPVTIETASIQAETLSGISATIEVEAEAIIQP